MHSLHQASDLFLLNFWIQNHHNKFKAIPPIRARCVENQSWPEIVLKYVRKYMRLLFQQAHHTQGEAIYDSVWQIIHAEFVFNWNLHKHYERASEGAVLLADKNQSPNCLWSLRFPWHQSAPKMQKVSEHEN